MDRGEALEKIRKLMALGANTSEHEAAAAIARAQAMAERYEIELADLGDVGNDPDAAMTEGTWELNRGKGARSWKGSLASLLAKSNGCALFEQGTRVTTCGRRADVRRTAKLWEWLCPEVDRLAAMHRGNGASWLNSFRVGVVSAIATEIRAERDKLREELRGTVTETALVIVDTRAREASVHMYAKHKLRTVSSRRRVGSAGYAAGQSAGAGAYGRAGQGQVGAGSGRIGG